MRPKFQKDDTVWFIKKGKLFREKITGIVIRDFEGHYTENNSYIEYHFQFLRPVKEEFVAKSRKLLFQKLVDTFEEDLEEEKSN